ncbi:hypothetical protein JCM10212_001903 [Sporobolomyces blumeae]
MSRASHHRRRSPSPAAGGSTDDQPDLDPEIAQLELKDRDKTCRHLFLQALIARRTLSSDLAKALYKDCTKVCQIENPAPLEDFMGSIELGLGMCGLDIKATRDQETGKGMYILINSIQDGPAKIATEYKAEEIAFFKTIVEKIMLARNLSYSVTQVDAIKGAKAPITRMVAIQLIKSFLAKGWLTLHDSGRLILSPRSLVELRPYLRETFKDDEDDEDEDEEDEDEERDLRHRAVVDCDFCLQIVTSGYACPNAACGVRLHTFCTAQRLGATGECPAKHATDESKRCKQDWRKDPNSGRFVGVPVGIAVLSHHGGDPDAASSSSDGELEDPTTAAAKAVQRQQQERKKKDRRASHDGGPNGAAKGKGKGKGKRRRRDEDDDEMGDVDGEDESEEIDSDIEALSHAVSQASSSARISSRVKQTARRVADSDEDMEE